MDLAELSWRVISEDVRGGAMQMALDEIAAETASRDGLATIRVYRWDPGTVSLGYTQSADILNWAFCDSRDFDVTRRQTGGGTIFHDTVGDISYSIVVPADAVPSDLMESYRLLCAPLFDALEGIGVDARFVDAERSAVFEPACYLRALHPAHDIVGPDDRKLSGNAQYRQREAVVQHGSITFERATDDHLRVFDECPVTAADFEERVGAIADYTDCSRASAVDTLSETLADWADADEGNWSDSELAAARERAREKFESSTWVRDRSDPT